MKKLWLMSAALVLVLTGCTQKNLAVASDAIAHALSNAGDAEQQAVTAGIVDPATDAAFKADESKVALAGLALDNAIRANETATTLAPKVNAFLDAFNTLDTEGVLGITDPATKLAISTALTTAETSVAVIAAAVGK